MDILNEGVTKGLISFDEEQKYITYLNPPNKSYRYRFTDPEEPVRAEAYLQLIIEYEYPAERLALEVPVKMGVDTKSADIIVYNDDAQKDPHRQVTFK